MEEECKSCKMLRVQLKELQDALEAEKNAKTEALETLRAVNQKAADDLLKRKEREESRKKMQEIFGSNIPSCMEESEDEEGDDGQVHLNDFHDVEPIPFNILFDVSAEQCPYCLSSPRHSDCENSKLCHIYHCSNCGRRGTRVHQCPRCYYAYYGFLESIQKTELDKPAVPEIHDKPVSTIKSILRFVTGGQDNPLSIVPQILQEKKITTRISHNLLKHVEDGWVMSWSFGIKKMFNHTSNDYAQDFANLVDKISHLSVGTRDIIILHFMAERQRAKPPKISENTLICFPGGYSPKKCLD